MISIWWSGVSSILYLWVWINILFWIYKKRWKDLMDKSYKLTESEKFVIECNCSQYLTLSSQEGHSHLGHIVKVWPGVCQPPGQLVTWQSFIAFWTEAWSPTRCCCFSLFSWVSNHVFIPCTLFSYSDHDSNKPSNSWIWTKVMKWNFKSLAGHYFLQTENSKFIKYSPQYVWLKMNVITCESMTIFW